MSKRGQLTLFVIVGIVLITIFAFLFFAVQSISGAKLRQQAEQNLNQIIQSSTLNSFVNQCVEKSLDDGLKLIGVQGGKILKEQGGTATADFIPFFRDLKQENVSYGIKRDTTICASEPPEYPCLKNNSICNNPSNFDSPAYCAFSYPTAEFYRYSINQLPPLCKTAQDCSFEARSCPTGAAACALRSIQGQLEAYISNKTDECVKLDQIAALNASVKLSKGNVTTKISIGESNVVAVVNFPIMAQFQGYPQITKIDQFSATASVRLKQIYQFADDLVKQNTEKLGFDILGNATSSIYANEQFSLTRLKNVRDTDDIYMINDTTAFISNQNFYFQFAVQNRFPVLNYIGGSIQKTPIRTDCGEYDVIAIEGQQLQIDPVAFDPDNDPLTVRYSGWRQDYNETFNLQNIQIVNDCPVFRNPIIKIPTSERWEDSRIFSDTRSNASIYLTKDDVGPHEFIINSSGREFGDWQRIRILVQDMFSVGGSAKSGYSDITCVNCISLEDPVFLEGDISQVFNPGGYSFRWLDRTNNNILLGTSKDLLLPISYNFFNIKQILATLFPAPNVHALNITASQGNLESSDEFNVNIFECLPHRNANSDPYPYNTTDAFLSDHTCCSDSGQVGVLGSGWGEILGNSVECFSESTFGYLFGFDLNKYGGQGTITYKDYSGTIINPSASADHGNDIFERKFAAHCDGRRGNSCEGTVDETIQAVDECEDLSNHGTGGSARCSGPPQTYVSSRYSTSTAPSCTGYSGTTFEKLTELSTSDLCNSALRCTQGPGQTYSSSSSGDFKCQGTCNSGNCNSASSCVNCRTNGQTCSDSDSGNNPQTQGTVTGIDGTGCSSANCQTQAYSFADSCANQNTLTEYNCPTNPAAQDQPYTIATTNCGTILDTAATGDTDDSPGSGSGSCTDGNQASCGTGKCNVATGGTSHTEVCTGSSPGNYNYVEWVATDNNEGGSGVKERCNQVNHDLDDAQSICALCNSALKWYASGYSQAFGGYSAGQSNQECCGDDVGEIPSDSPNGNIHRCCPSGTTLTNSGICQ